jgi:hypothetical protein
VLTEEVAEIVLGDLLAPDAPVFDLDSSTLPAAPQDIAGVWRSAERQQHLILSASDGTACIDLFDESLPLEQAQPGMFTYPPFRLQLGTDVASDTVRIPFDGKVSTFTRVTPWNPDSEDLAALTGTYWSEELAVSYQIVEAGETTGPTIAIRRRKFKDEVFQPLAPDTFVRNSLDLRFPD